MIANESRDAVLPTANGVALSNARERPLAFPDDFEKCDGLHRPIGTANSDFDYSDGDAVEAEIHQIVRSASDRSSASFELEKGIHDWPTHYHLSRVRCNLLRPFDLAQYENVLEIGSGCGAITRYLAETCRQVTALEGSPKRAAIVRDRCADLGNVTCVCANVDDVRFTSKFDLVVVVGVLEYAGKYLADHGDPWQYFLQLVLSALAPGGTCILAIENQLGMKYFGGAAEDHTGRPYEGVEGYYPGTLVRTFGKVGLEQCFERAGMATSLYLPFPDYKLPRLVINADSANKGLGLSQWHDQAQDTRRFSEPLVLCEIEKNGLLADLANSFVVVATRGDEPIRSCSWDAIYYSINRRPQFQTETRLEEIDGRRTVRKAHLVRSAPIDAESPVRQNVGRTPFLKGEKLSLQMLRSLRRGDIEGETEFRRLLTVWRDFLIQRAGPEKVHRALLPKDLLDCTPFNLLVTNSGLKIIDQEWILEKGDVTVGSVLFRGLYWFLVSYWKTIRRQRVRRGQWGPFIQDQFAFLDYRLAPDELRMFARHEAAFQAAVLHGRMEKQLTGEILQDLGPLSPIHRVCHAATARTTELAKRMLKALRDDSRD